MLKTNKALIDHYYDIALNFRKSVELTMKERTLFTIFSFPNGACGPVTRLLGTFLQEKDLGASDYICGERWIEQRKSTQTHAWLQKKSLIIDITADQFAGEITDPVIITDNSIWHLQFKAYNKGLASIFHSNLNPKFDLEADYSYIIEKYNSVFQKA
jgi:hypothetical protein